MTGNRLISLPSTLGNLPLLERIDVTNNPNLHLLRKGSSDSDGHPLRIGDEEGNFVCSIRWNALDHWRFPLKERECLKFLLMVALHRKGETCPLRKLSKDVLLEIFYHLFAEVFVRSCLQISKHCT
jgi:hypothetical protein